MDALFNVRSKQLDTDLALDQLRVVCACLTSRHHVRVGALQQQLDDLIGRWDGVKRLAITVRVGLLSCWAGGHVGGFVLQCCSVA
jgi:hypothetical protein